MNLSLRCSVLERDRHHSHRSITMIQVLRHPRRRVRRLPARPALRQPPAAVRGRRTVPVRPTGGSGLRGARVLPLTLLPLVSCHDCNGFRHRRRLRYRQRGSPGPTSRHGAEATRSPDTKVPFDRVAARTLDHIPEAVYLAAHGDCPVPPVRPDRERMAFQPFPNELGRGPSKRSAACAGRSGRRPSSSSSTTTD